MLAAAIRRDHERVKDDRRPTVLIADAHERYRNGIVRAIESYSGLRVSGVTDDGLATLSLILSQRPQVALVDVRLPRLDGFSISARLLNCQPRPPTRVLLLTAVLDQAQRDRARSVGAVGCLGKDASRLEICDALLAAAAGEWPQPPQPGQQPQSNLQRPVAASATGPGRSEQPDVRAG